MTPILKPVGVVGGGVVGGGVVGGVVPPGNVIVTSLAQALPVTLVRTLNATVLPGEAGGLWEVAVRVAYTGVYSRHLAHVDVGADAGDRVPPQRLAVDGEHGRRERVGGGSRGGPSGEGQRKREDRGDHDESPRPLVRDGRRHVAGFPSMDGRDGAEPTRRGAILCQRSVAMTPDARRAAPKDGPSASAPAP